MYHCVKSVCIWGYFGLHSPAFGVNSERHGVSLRIQSECGKIQIRITPDTDTFHAVYICIYKLYVHMIYIYVYVYIYIYVYVYAYVYIYIYIYRHTFSSCLLQHCNIYYLCHNVCSPMLSMT